ncbi:MAG: diaminopimelate decarboxylase [Ignavibacteriales bacterium]|jgi:diaminopimelate decarboxylase|nr:diaminopimelate decarboxylase [Ignavibacteriaceae bacterium]NLH61345.1 diaminopimelate decarboxylase [Ignavibacteriales bacterium]HOJ18617.1 diaminopimelate decarboxylase [Ignavibacteriaceae bacterium]HPO56941.1 diaminopimelate decarboxylase [Ignavibacteriaceae bacterium]
MEYINYGEFVYKNDELYCEDIPVSQIIRNVGTPAYIYSKKYITRKYLSFSDAFKEVDHKIFYAVKSNSNLSILKIFAGLGSYFDANSIGEIERVERAGVSPSRIGFSGVGKTEEEIEFALSNEILVFKSESEEEIILIDQIAGRLNKKALVSVRVNPDVDPHTHPYISTGLAENKFGINAADSLDVFRRCSRLKNVILDGIDMHIGSQINNPEPFVEAVSKLSEIFFTLKGEEINLKHVDVGGGFGIKYKTEIPLNIIATANKLIPLFKKLDCEIYFEPGRFLTANSGILVSKVLYSKKNMNKHFIIVDAAMNDLIRPSLYDAYHYIQPLMVLNGKKDIYANIVGPVCESGDFFAKERVFPLMSRNDLIAIMSAGSYGMVMSSNYNARLRPAEVLVDNHSFSIIRSRETIRHMLYDEEELLKG